MAERKAAAKATSTNDESKTNDEMGTGPGDAEVQAKKDAEDEKGFRGVEVDPTPNENYTLAGQNAGAPTPETDDAAAKAAAEAQDAVAKQATGVSER